MYFLFRYEELMSFAEHISDPINFEMCQFAVTFCSFILLVLFFGFFTGYLFGETLNFCKFIIDKFSDKRSSRSSSEERDDSSELPGDKNSSGQ